MKILENITELKSSLIAFLMSWSSMDLRCIIIEFKKKNIRSGASSLKL